MVFCFVGVRLGFGGFDAAWGRPEGLAGEPGGVLMNYEWAVIFIFLR